MKERISANYLGRLYKKRASQTKLVASNKIAKPGVPLNCRYVTNVLQEFVLKRKVARTRTVAKLVLD